MVTMRITRRRRCRAGRTHNTTGLVLWIRRQGSAIIRSSGGGPMFPLNTASPKTGKTCSSPMNNAANGRRKSVKRYFELFKFFVVILTFSGLRRKNTKHLGRLKADFPPYTSHLRPIHKINRERYPNSFYSYKTFK